MTILITLLIPSTIKVTLVLGTAWALSRAMTRGSAAARHLVWTTALVAALIIPVAQVMAPRWNVAVLPANPAPAVVVAVPLAERIAAAPVVERVPGDDVAPVAARQRSAQWPTVLMSVWLAGAFLALLRLVTGVLWAGWITRRGTPVTDPQWLSSLEDTRAALGVRARVSLRYSSRTTIPVACGIVRPAVLLPVDADDWSEERRRVVLIHEMAHVRRRDCLVQAVAEVARGLHWFNPLAHVAITTLRAEQERACDDLVLASGTKAPIYADHLFEIAQAFRRAAFPLWATVAMARPSQLEGRVLAILDAGRNRRQPARGVRAAVATVALALVLLIGALELTAAAAPEVTEAAPVVAVLPARPATVATRAAPTGSTQSSPETSTNSDASRTTAEVRTTASNAQASDKLGQAVEKVLGDVPSSVVDSLPYFDFNFDPDSSQAQGRAGDSGISDETRRRVADALMAALNDESADVREEALSSLATLRDPRAIPGLLKMLRDPVPDLRERAVVALAQFNTPEAVDGIVSALKDANADVREQAARALGRVTRRRIAPPPVPATPRPSVAPVPPGPPQVRIDEQAIRESVARAQEKAQRLVEEFERSAERSR